MTVTVIGNDLSPYARKALVCREFKGIRYEIDTSRWPRCASHLARSRALPAFAALRSFEAIQMRTPIAAYREALLAAGATLAATTPGTDVPRRGLFSI